MLLSLIKNNLSITLKRKVEEIECKNSGFILHFQINPLKNA